MLSDLFDPATIGQTSLYAGGLLAAASAALAAGAAGSPGRVGGRAGARVKFDRAMGALFACCAVALCLSGAILWYLLLSQDFGVEYVYSHTDSATPLIYRITAFWAGQEGSLLLWTCLMALFSLLAWRQTAGWARGTPGSRCSAMLLLWWTTAFFALLTAALASPFELLPKPRSEGLGMSPSLLRWEMAVHPVMLYLGYLGLAVAYSITMALSKSDSRPPGWHRLLRLWLLFSFASLSAGILVGARWAYLELGWGGYWAWDPIETSSLIPWLLSAVALHKLPSVKSELATGLSYSSAMFGVYLTRSGAAESVHAFADPKLGLYLLVFALLTLVPLILRSVFSGFPRHSRSPIENCGSTHAGAGSASLVGSRFDMTSLPDAIMLVGAAIVVAGILIPLVSGLVGGTKIHIGPQYFNITAGPLAGILVILILVWGWRWITLRRPPSTGTALIHIGLVIGAIGAAGSLGDQSYKLNLVAGQPEVVGDFWVRLETMTESQEGLESEVSALVSLGHGDDAFASLTSSKRFWLTKDQTYTTVDVHGTAAADYYVVLNGWAAGGNEAYVTLFVKPLVRWIWIGSYLVLLGAGLNFLSSIRERGRSPVLPVSVSSGQ